MTHLMLNNRFYYSVVYVSFFIQVEYKINFLLSIKQLTTKTFNFNFLIILKHNNLFYKGVNINKKKKR